MTERAAMTAAQLAERRSVHPDTIRKKVARGELPKLKLFKTIRIRMWAILEAEGATAKPSDEKAPPAPESEKEHHDRALFMATMPAAEDDPLVRAMKSLEVD